MTTTVFTEMTELALRTGAVNLGQGAPDSDGPPAMLEAAQRAIRDGRNQYPPLTGDPELREAIAARRWLDHGTRYDPDTEVLVTTGATEGVCAGVLALAGPGDEVIVLEPYYDAYAAAVDLAGARRRAVPLRRTERGFALDEAALRAAVGPRTRLLLLNTPHNPTGTVLTPAELDAVARVCVEHGLRVIADEVYEHLCFDGRRHTAIAGAPGMASRTLSVSSAGKTFNATGWKVGWVCGPRDLVERVRHVKQYLTFATGSAFQPAVALALRECMSWVAAWRAQLELNRDALCAALSRCGARPLAAAGGYFVQIDSRDLGFPDGVTMCRALPEQAGVVAIPTSVFYDAPDTGAPFVRFAFCKRPEIVEEAGRRLVAALADARTAHHPPA